MNIAAQTNRGFSLVKLMVLVGLVSVFIMIMFNRAHDGAIRTKVGQGLNDIESAKLALVQACQRQSKAVISDNSDAGFAYFGSIYVADIRVSGDCASGSMKINVRTQNTGAPTSPELVFVSDNGLFLDSGQDEAWDCILRKGERAHVPEECRAAKTS